MNRKSQLSHTIYSYCILNLGPDPVIVITPTPVLRYAVPIDDGDGFASIDLFTPATKVDPAPAYPLIAVGINGLYFNRFNR
jgi:hypothetical protein